MGPITLFDKSFLQSLNLDEAVWFDHFFLANVAPVFFVETLGDLAKVPTRGRYPEDEVRALADKFPEAGGMPCVHHAAAVLGDLSGHSVPMTGQIPIARGRPVKSSQRAGIVVDVAPEAQAFERWQRRDFEAIERGFAKEWRERLATLDFSDKTGIFAKLGISGRTCRSLDSARERAVELAEMLEPADAAQMVLGFIGAPKYAAGEALYGYARHGFPPFCAFRRSRTPVPVEAEQAFQSKPNTLRYSAALSDVICPKRSPCSTVSASFAWILPSA